MRKLTAVSESLSHIQISSSVIEKNYLIHINKENGKPTSTYVILTHFMTYNTGEVEYDFWNDNMSNL